MSSAGSPPDPQPDELNDDDRYNWLKQLHSLTNLLIQVVNILKALNLKHVATSVFIKGNDTAPSKLFDTAPSVETLFNFTALYKFKVMRFKYDNLLLGNLCYEQMALVVNVDKNLGSS